MIWASWSLHLLHHDRAMMGRFLWAGLREWEVSESGNIEWYPFLKDPPGVWGTGNETAQPFRGMHCRFETSLYVQLLWGREAGRLTAHAVRRLRVKHCGDYQYPRDCPSAVSQSCGMRIPVKPSRSSLNRPGPESITEDISIKGFKSHPEVRAWMLLPLVCFYCSRCACICHLLS